MVPYHGSAMGHTRYTVYTIKLLPTRDCVHEDPCDYYVGSTYDVEVRLGQHEKKMASKGYRLGAVRRGRSFDDRDDAEREERRVAKELRDNGHRVWQGLSLGRDERDEAGATGRREGQPRRRGTLGEGGRTERDWAARDATNDPRHGSPQRPAHVEPGHRGRPRGPALVVKTPVDRAAPGARLALLASVDHVSEGSRILPRWEN